MDINKVQLLGNVGKDPEIKTGDDWMLAKFSMATSYKYKDNEHTEWHNVVCFDDRIVDVIQKYVKKGSRIQIFGEIRTRKYNKDGVDRYITEIVIPKFRGELILIGKVKDGGASTEPTGAPIDDGFDDEIPF